MCAVPEFQIVRGEPNSWIIGWIDGNEVTRASFKECADPFRRELIQVETPPEHQRRGYALALLKYLEQAAPLVDSPIGMNTEAGIAMVENARQKGVAIHQFGCYRDGARCTCSLGNQSA